MAAPDKKKYKVKYGPPSKSPQDLEHYMQSRQDLHTLDTDGKDIKQEINDKLLQIISEGIDNIVLNLKLKLGDDFENSNAKAFEISDILNKLKDSIDRETETIGKDNGVIVNDVIQIDIDANRSHEVSPNKRLFYRQDIHPDIKDENIEIKNDHEFKNLDDKYDSILKTPEAQRSVDAGTRQADSSEIETRLKNCQNLELLYLKKHDEIMKIFEFTINLFDKYKYAIKVILFLLKNLVYKEPGTTPKIDLPLPIITNIKKLVQDQASVQGIINDMKTSLDPKNKNIFSDTPEHNSEKILNTKILTTPQNPAAPP